MNQINHWMVGLGAMALTAGCFPLGPYQVSRYSPEQVVQYQERELVITGAVAQTIYDDFEEEDKLLRMQIEVNGEKVIEGQFESWLGPMVVTGDYQGVPVAAHCVERLPYDFASDVYCRIYVDGRRTVLLSMVFGRDDYPTQALTEL